VFCCFQLFVEQLDMGGDKKYLLELLHERARAVKFAFVVGTGERTGVNSSVRDFYNHGIFDVQLLPLIFELL